MTTYEFLQELQKDVMKRVAYANPASILGQNELTILYFSGEFNENHQTEIGFSNDDETGIKTIIINRCVNDKLVFHQFIVIENPNPDVETPYGVTSVNTQFNGDADCDIMAALYQHIPGMSWRRVEDRTVTLCDKLDHAIRQTQQPSFEEFIHKIIDEILAEGPGNWDDNDEDKDA